MYIRTLLALLLMAAAGCYSDETIGVSKRGKIDRGDRAEDKPDAVVSKHQMPVAISGQPGEIVSLGEPLLGDVDGDGFDDFVLTASADPSSPDANSFTSSLYRLYLFYGRPEWPEQLSTADADAVFQASFGQWAGAAGDLNGDGFADLMVQRDHSVQLVFGGTERLHGAIAPETGSVWMAADLPPPFAPGLSAGFEVGPLGDVDGDGCADIRVLTNMLLGPQLDVSTNGLAIRSYLVKGHSGEWTSGMWDPAWAAVRFGADMPEDGATSYSSTYPTPAGDLNGDGRADLIAYGADRMFLFYGRQSLPEELGVGDADATLRTAPADSGLSPDQVPSIVVVSIGDLDGDGRDELGLIDSTHGTVSVSYGREWSGDVLLEPDFTLQVKDAVNQSVTFLQAGDIDGDAIPELLASVGSSLSFDIGSSQPLPRPGIYVLRGSGKRLAGTRQLGAADLWAAPEGELGQTGTHFNFQFVGDVDGNDGQDIILTLEDDSALGAPRPLYLVPSTPLSPQ